MKNPLRWIADRTLGPCIAWAVGWACAGVNLKILNITTAETIIIEGGN